jgi:hypothetical protein
MKINSHRKLFLLIIVYILGAVLLITLITILKKKRDNQKEALWLKKTGGHSRSP